MIGGSAASVLASVAGYLRFLPALALDLGLFGISGLILWLRLATLLGVRRSRLAEITVGGLLGLYYVGLLATLLVIAGRFSPGLFFVLWGAGLGLILLDTWRRGLLPAAGACWRAAHPLPKWFWAIALLWLILYGRPFEAITGGRDPGIYVNMAAQFAERGVIAAPDPFMASLDPATQRQLVWCAPYCPPGLIPMKYPGYFWIGGPDGKFGSDPGIVLPQFMDFYPALMAPGYAIAGYSGALAVLPWGMFLLAILLAELGQMVRRELWEPEGWAGGLVAFFVLACPVMLWFGRLANADVFLGLFCFAALFFWYRAQAEDGSISWPLALLSLGIAGLTKIDVWYLLPIIIIAAQLYHPAVPRGRPALGAVLWAGTSLIYLLTVRWFTYPYILGTLRTQRIELTHHGYWPLVVAGVYLLIATAAGVFPPLLSPTTRAKLRVRWGRAVTGVPVAAAAVVVISLPLSGGLSLLTNSMFAPAPIVLGYLAWPALILALAGLLYLALRARHSPLAIVLLAAFVSNGLYTLRFTTHADLPWSLRRVASITFPLMMLAAGLAAAQLVCWIRGPKAHRTVWRSFAGFALLALAGGPLLAKDVPFVAYAESQGAVTEFQRVRSIFPPGSVVLSDGTQAANLLGPALSVDGTREVLNFFVSDETPVFQPWVIDRVADKALTAGRPFFYMTESEAPPVSTLYQFGRYWREVWPLQRAVNAASPESLEVETVNVPVYVYELLSPSSEADGRPGTISARYEAEALPSTTGQTVQDPAAGNGWARSAQAGLSGEGALVFGPYEQFAPGAYVAEFRLRTGPASAAAPNELRVLAPDLQVLASVSIAPALATYTEVSVPFTVGQREPLEFTLIYSGGPDIWLDRIEVLRDAP